MNEGKIQLPTRLSSEPHNSVSNFIPASNLIR